MARTRTFVRAGVLLPALILACTVTGASAANLFATVNSAGVLISGGGVSSVSHAPGSGQYQGDLHEQREPVLVRVDDVQ